MNQLLDTPELPGADPELERIKARKKGVLWTIIYITVSVSQFIVTVGFLPWYRNDATGSAERLGYYLGSLMGPFIMNLLAGLVIWLLVWPFVRKKMKWRFVAMYSSFSGMFFLLVALLQLVRYYLYAA
jgi:hypothetical protein